MRTSRTITFTEASTDGVNVGEDGRRLGVNVGALEGGAQKKAPTAHAEHVVGLELHQLPSAATASQAPHEDPKKQQKLAEVGAKEWVGIGLGMTLGVGLVPSQ